VKKRKAKPGRPARMKYVHFRFPAPLIERIDVFAREESSRTGYHVTRSQALRRLVEIALTTQTPRPAPERPLRANMAVPRTRPKPSTKPDVREAEFDPKKR